MLQAADLRFVRGDDSGITVSGNNDLITVSSGKLVTNAIAVNVEDLLEEAT